MNVDNWIIPECDAHVCVLGMLDRGFSSLEVVDNTLDHSVVLARVRKIQNKIKMCDLGELMLLHSRTQSCMTQ